MNSLLAPTTFDTDAFVDGYIEAALWADCMPADRCVECDELLTFEATLGAWQHAAQEADDWCSLGRSPQRDENAESGSCEGLELRDGARDKMAGDCLTFIEANQADLIAYCEQRSEQWNGPGTGPLDGIESYAGHDFWLTRVGHGAGFWDRGLGDLGERLTDASKAYGMPDDHTPYDCGDGTADV